MNESIATVVSNWIGNSDLQTAILLGLTCIGAWVVLTWLICFLYTIIWPLLLFLVLMTFCPNLTCSVVHHVLPKYTEMMGMITRLCHVTHQHPALRPSDLHFDYNEHHNNNPH